jgi:hypothetical protein
VPAREPEATGMRGAWVWVATNPWTKLLSLLLATLAWLYVQGEEIREERVKVQVAWILPEGLVATEPLPVTAFLVVRGSRTAINRAHGGAIRLVVDVADLSKGEHTVDLSGVNPEGLPPTVERLGITPGSVRFNLDQVTTHHVQINPVLVGDPAEGYVIGSVTLMPAVVELRGPQQAISLLREVSTRPIDVSGLQATIEREVTLDLPRGVDLADPVSIRARLQVASELEQRRIENVPVYGWGTDRLSIEPGRVSVMLEGPGEALQRLQPDRVVAFVHGAELILQGALTEREPVEVWYGPRDGARVEVLHPGDELKVVSMTPPSVSVSRSRP